MLCGAVLALGGRSSPDLQCSGGLSPGPFCVEFACSPQTFSALGGRSSPECSVLRWAISRAFLCGVCMFSPDLQCSGGQVLPRVHSAQVGYLPGLSVWSLHVLPRPSVLWGAGPPQSAQCSSGLSPGPFCVEFACSPQTFSALGGRSSPECTVLKWAISRAFLCGVC